MASSETETPSSSTKKRLSPDTTNSPAYSDILILDTKRGIDLSYVSNVSFWLLLQSAYTKSPRASPNEYAPAIRESIKKAGARFLQFNTELGQWRNMTDEECREKIEEGWKTLQDADGKLPKVLDRIETPPAHYKFPAILEHCKEAFQAPTVAISSKKLKLETSPQKTELPPQDVTMTNITESPLITEPITPVESGESSEQQQAMTDMSPPPADVTKATLQLSHTHLNNVPSNSLKRQLLEADFPFTPRKWQYFGGWPRPRTVEATKGLPFVSINNAMNQ